MEICRVFTFYNYQNPIMPNVRKAEQYTTIGVFDGMDTESIKDYGKEELKSLWIYGLKEKDMNQGKRSCQSIFCFSDDRWNSYKDALFWTQDTNEMYPLTFVVFVQLKKYSGINNTIQMQFEEFNSIIKDASCGECVSYVYSTIGKNDYVVCIKSRSYGKATEIIKCLYKISAEVVYSFSTFSVNNNVLDNIECEKYKYLFQQELDSICLKGGVNSFGSAYSLNDKYNDFCRKLVLELYTEDEIIQKEKDGQFRIYDILGVDDFRLIARNVNLGKLLKQFGKGNLLSCEENVYRFNFISLNVALNIISNACEKISDEDIDLEVQRMTAICQTPGCDNIEKEMKEIKKRIASGIVGQDEKTLNICHAMWQLLQSLKILELSPAKKYDFWSIYQSFYLFVRIIEEKLLGIGEETDESEITEHEEIYDFFNKINMILQSTLRTDIPFFHNRGFNVIVNYVPVKMRAFYSIWALKVSDYYNEFVSPKIKNEYSFILTSGMFRETSVKQLYDEYRQDKRLMLITVPEKYLYTPKCLLIILGHEVSHYVGYTVRKREKRHIVWIGCMSRIIELELNYLRYYVCGDDYKKLVEKGISEKSFFQKIYELLIQEEKIIREKVNKKPHEFHSKNSFQTIRQAFFNMSEKYMEKLILDDCCYIYNFLVADVTKMIGQKKYKKNDEIRNISYGLELQMVNMQKLFQSKIQELLQIFKHVTTEAHADLNVILTLDLSPKEYVSSFVQSELEETQAGIDIVRMAHTIDAIRRGIEKRPELFNKKGFCRDWKDTPIENMLRKLEKNSSEYKIAYKVYRFIQKKSNQNSEISKYKSIYNYKKKAFVNSDWDFFADEEIWNLLSQYLDECVSSYLEKLNEKENNEKKSKLQIQKERLVSSFRKIDKSGMVMLQEVEEFLESYDQESVKQITEISN